MERPEPKLGTQTETVVERIAAWIGDRILLFVAATVLSMVLGLNFSGFLLVAGVLSFGYSTYLEATYGQTLGKRALGIVVVTEDGDPCDWQSSVVRNLLRLVDGFMLYLVGMVAILLSGDDQRIGDVLGNTVVTKVAAETEPEPEPEPEWSGFEITLHSETDGGARYLEVNNQTGQAIDLSRGTLRTESGSEFRFPQDEAIHEAGETKTFRLSDEFAIETGEQTTMVTRSAEQYDVRWATD